MADCVQLLTGTPHARGPSKKTGAFARILIIASSVVAQYVPLSSSNPSKLRNEQENNTLALTAAASGCASRFTWRRWRRTCVVLIFACGPTEARSRMTQMYVLSLTGNWARFWALLRKDATRAFSMPRIFIWSIRIHCCCQCGSCSSAGCTSSGIQKRSRWFLAETLSRIYAHCSWLLPFSTR